MAPIELRCTDPSYTKTVLPIDKCRHTQGRQTPPPPCKLNQSVQSLLHQDSMTLLNADIPSVNVPHN